MIEELAAGARAAGLRLAQTDTAVKNAALLNMSGAILREKESIKAANRRDMAYAREKGISGAMLKRLELTDAKIEQM